MEAHKDRQRQSAGAIPNFDGERPGDSIRVNEWLSELESWFDLAGIEADADAERITVLGRALEKKAQQWWTTMKSRDAAMVAAGGGAQSELDTWTKVVAAMRKHYLPQSPERWALQALLELTSREHANVQQYTARFRVLERMVSAQRNEIERVFTYERGLPERYRVKSAQAQHSTIDAAADWAVTKWNAEGITKSRGPTSEQRPSRGKEARVHRIETGDDDDDYESEGDEHMGRAAASAYSSKTRADIESMQATIAAMQTALANKPHFRDRTIRNKQGRGEGQTRERSRTPGVSEELAKARLNARVCIKCGRANHYARDCTNATETQNTTN